MKEGNHMSGMKPWERDIIEYRPQIGLNREILSVVDKTKYIARFKPSKVVERTTKMYGIDMIDRLLATLSQGANLLREVETSLGNNDVFTKYKSLLADDPIEARELYLHHLADIDGHSHFDVYPVLSEALDEMEEYLDYLNEELFDGRVDYSNTVIVREQEEEKIVGLLSLESEDVQLLTEDTLTDEQHDLIQRMIEDDRHPLTSKTEYITYVNQERQREGSPRIDYNDLANHVQFVATADEKTQYFQALMSQVDSYIHTLLPEQVGGDIEGSLAYLTDIEGSLTDLAEGMALSFNYHAKKAQDSYINMLRVADRSVRLYLDKQVSDVRKQREKFAGRLKQYFDTERYQQEGAQALMFTMQESVESINAMWKYVVVEHIGTSDMNRDQTGKFFEFLHHKQRNQSLYHYTRLVDNEFDRSNKSTELTRFISTHKLHNRR
jgi:hypothetical protein